MGYHLGFFKKPMWKLFATPCNVMKLCLTEQVYMANHSPLIISMWSNCYAEAVSSILYTVAVNCGMVLIVYSFCEGESLLTIHFPAYFHIEGICLN